MSFEINSNNNMDDKKKPLADLSLNYSGPVVNGGGGINNGDHVNDLKMMSSANTKRYDHIISSHLQYPISSTVSKKTNHCTPDHRRRANAPFKSPITLCFERMLGAGKFVKFTPGNFSIYLLS